MNSVTSIQRVNQVLSRSQAAQIARGELVVDLQFARELLTWKGEGSNFGEFDDTDLLIECCRVLKLDLVCLQSDQVVDEHLKLDIGLENIQRFRDADLFVFWIVNGAFQSAVHRHGLMDIFSMISKSPDELAADFKSTSEQIMASMDQGVDAGAHGIILADDIAYNQSTYMSPGFIEKYLQPAWRVQTAKANELGAPIFFHSDGNLNQVLPNIIDAGFDGLQCIEPAAGMDIVEISTQYGESLGLMGGIDPALLIHNKTLYDIETARNNLHQAVTTVLESELSKSGFILGSCSGLYEGMSPELVYSMYQLISEFNAGHFQE